MVTPFGLLPTPRIFFGAGQAGNLPGFLQLSGKHLLVITGANSFLNNQGTTSLLAALETKGFILHFERIHCEPTPDDIDRITGCNDPSEVNGVLAIGGGSVMDAGKAVSAMLEADGSVRDYLEGVGTKKHSGIKKYFIAIPTTSGTGSEATSNAVITQTGVNGFKRSLRHEHFVPDIAVVDPVLITGCPEDITASSGMDAFSQLLESYLSLKANPVTDALALDGIRRIHISLVNAVKNGFDLEARSNMAYAALLSGITLANAGLGLVHGFASSVGGFFNMPHGSVCGTLMGVVNRYNINALLQLTDKTAAHVKYAEVGRLLSEATGKSAAWYMKFTADYIEELTEKLHIRRLGEYGVTSGDAGRIAANTDHKANPVSFQNNDLEKMIQERI